jgi:EAL and modified HD-GYP domain-containing signal transduction protein
MTEQQQVEESPAPVERVVARQPIVGRDDRIVGFQLLHRPTPSDESPAVTAETVTVSALLGDLSLDVDALVGGTQLYRPAGDLVSGTGLVPPPGRPALLGVPGEQCTLPGVVARCQLLRGIGYWLAIDVVAWQPELEPLLPELDVVRVDLARASRDDVVDLVARCASYDVNLLAASCLTEDDLTWAADAGFGLFQGPAVQRPVEVSGTTLAPSSLARVQLATELLDDRLDFARVEAILNHEPALVVQVLKQASLGAGGGLRREVHSVRDALVLMGTTRIRPWAALTVLGRQVSNNRTDALAVALVRAWMCELLAQAHGIDRGFAFTAGLLSALDRLLGAPIDQVEQSVDVDDELAAAAFRREGPLGELVGAVADYQDAVAAGEPAGTVPGDTGLVAAMAFCWAMSHVNAIEQEPSAA